MVQRGGVCVCAQVCAQGRQVCGTVVCGGGACVCRSGGGSVCVWCVAAVVWCGGVRCGKGQCSVCGAVWWCRRGSGPVEAVKGVGHVVRKNSGAIVANIRATHNGNRCGYEYAMCAQNNQCWRISAIPEARRE